MIERFTIKMAPAMTHSELMKQFEQGGDFSPEQVNRLSKVKAKIEVIGDYTDLERIRELLNKLS